MKRVLLGFAIGCGSSSDRAPSPPPPPVVAVAPPDAAAPPDAGPLAPIPVAFGDCAGPTTTWRSGGVIAAAAPHEPTIEEQLRSLGDPSPATGIGTGRIRVGHGGGVGVGLGAPGYTPWHDREPIGLGTNGAVKIGEANVSNTTRSKTDVTRVVRRATARFTGCYQEAVARNPRLEIGTIVAHFIITEAGLVESPNVDGLDSESRNCFGEVLRKVAFPALADADYVEVTIPFKIVRSPDPPPAPPARPRPPTPPVAQVSHPNPLAGETEAIAACVRQGPQKFGAVVVGFEYDAAGAVTKATADGADGALGDCIAGIARRVKRVDASGTAQRCPLAFGELALDTLPAIALDATTAADGKLAAAIAASFPKSTEKPDDVVHLTTAVALRPADATPMKTVAFAIDKILAAHEDFVLVAHGHALSRHALPSVPSSHELDSHWHPIVRRGGHGAGLHLTASSDGKLAITGDGRVEITAEPTVTFAQVVAAIDMIAAAHRDWVLVISAN